MKRSGIFFNAVLLSVVTVLLWQRYRVLSELDSLRVEVETQQGRNMELERSVRALRAEVEAFEDSDSETLNVESQRSDTLAGGTGRLTATGHETQESVREEVEGSATRVASWRAKEFVSNVAETIALSDSDREALSKKFQEIATGPQAPSDQDRSKVIAEVMGAEGLARFEKVEAEKAAQARARAIDEETVVLARQLSLTPAQEASVRATLEQIETELKPKRESIKVVMREAMANHFGGDQAKDQLKTQYDLIQSLTEELKTTRDSRIFESLAPMLSDAQKNALLETQAAR